LLNNLELTREHCRRIYAVAMKNIPVAVGLGLSPLPSSRLGCLVTFAVMEKIKAKLRARMNSVSLGAFMRFAVVARV
jgi:hypothetical protein